MKITKIIICLMTLSLVYTLNAGSLNGLTVTCTGITTVKSDPGKPQYRIKLTQKSENCTSVTGEAVAEISEIVVPGASFTSIGKTFVTPKDGYFSYTVTATILIGDSGENVADGPSIAFKMEPDTITRQDDGIKWNITIPTDGTKVVTVGAIIEAIDLTQQRC